MATFRKKGNGWEAAVCKNGVRKSRSFPKKMLASHWAAELEKEISSGKNNNFEKKNFGELLRKYADEVSIKKRGAQWEIRRLNALLRDDIAKVMLRDIGSADFASWRDRRLKSVSSSTVRREMNLISHAINIAIKEWGWLPENPMKGVRRPAESAPRDILISQNKIDRLLFALGYDYESENLDTVSSRVGAALIFAIETAMRAGEIAKLKWTDVDIEKQVAVLLETKNGSKRRVPLSLEAIRITEQLRTNDSELVFNITSSQIDSLFRKAKKMALITDIRFHDSRHTAITRMAGKSNINVLDLARIVGHKDLRQLQTYFNAPAEELAKKLDEN